MTADFPNHKNLNEEVEYKSREGAEQTEQFRNPAIEWTNLQC